MDNNAPAAGESIIVRGQLKKSKYINLEGRKGFTPRSHIA